MFSYHSCQGHWGLTSQGQEAPGLPLVWLSPSCPSGAGLEVIPPGACLECEQEGEGHPGNMGTSRGEALVRAGPLGPTGGHPQEGGSQKHSELGPGAWVGKRQEGGWFGEFGMELQGVMQEMSHVPFHGDTAPRALMTAGS